MHYKLWIHEDCWLLNLYDDILPLSYCFYCLQQEKFEQSFSALQNTAFQWQMMQPLHLSLQLWQMGLHKLLMAQPHPRDCNLHKASEQPVSYSMGAWNKITVMLIADNLSLIHKIGLSTLNNILNIKSFFFLNVSSGGETLAVACVLNHKGTGSSILIDKMKYFRL